MSEAPPATAGVDSAAVRPEVSPNDLLTALGGSTLIAAQERAQESQRALVTRLIGLLLDGVRRPA